MTVKIEIFGENFAHALEEIRGFAGPIVQNSTPRLVGKMPELSLGYGKDLPALPEGQAAVEAAAESAKEAVENHEPAKRKRRTKAEIEADEAAAKAAQEAASATQENPTDDASESSPASTAETTATLASAPVATDPQDVADEAAETQATKEAAKVELTHDDVRKAVAAYGKKFGMDAAQADYSGIIGHAKIADVPQDGLADALAKIEAAVARDARTQTAAS